MAGIDINPVDPPLAAAFGRIQADLRARGLPIGVNDAWIAAEAVRYGQVLVTANTAEFERVAGLRIENWLA